MVHHHNPLLVRQYILLAIIPQVHSFRRFCRGSEGARADGSSAAEPGVRVGSLDITRSDAPAGVDDVEYFDEEWADCGDAGYDEDYPHLSSITFALEGERVIYMKPDVWTSGGHLIGHVTMESKSPPH
jgi:hypothetical protein